MRSGGFDDLSEVLAWGAYHVRPTLVPDAQKLAEGYNRHPNQDVFVIQGHPTHGDDARFAQFVQIVDFLTKAGVIFTMPAEYTRLKHPEVK